MRPGLLWCIIPSISMDAGGARMKFVVKLEIALLVIVILGAVGMILA